VSGIFNSFIFNNQVFNTGTAGPTPPVVVVDAKLGGGGIEGGGVYKPTGLTRKKLKLKKHDERIEEFNEAQIEITARLRQEFIEEPSSPKPISTMSMADIEAEIGMLMREKARTQEEEELMLLLLIAQANF
jgi:hypothetical protein